MAQPTKLPEWNSGLANQLEPSGGEKIAGYAVNQIPSSSKLNWLLYTAYTWLLYLKGLVAGTETWAGTLTLVQSAPASNGITASATATAITGTGAGTNSTGVAGISTGTAVGVFGQSSASGTGPAVRGDSQNSSGPGVEGNATGTGNGVKGTGGATSGSGVYGQGGAPNGHGGEFYGPGSQAAVYAENDGSGVAIDAFANAAPALKLTRSSAAATVAELWGWADLSHATPPATNAAAKSILTPNNLVQAWAVITTDGAGNATVVCGQNISGAVVSAGDVVFTLASTFSNPGGGIKWVPFVNGHATHRCFVNGSPLTTTTGSIEFTDVDGTTTIDAGAVATTALVLVMGI